MTTLPIHGFTINHFRSFCGPEQKIFPLQKINLFLGQNNSGKSNILRYLRHVHLPVFAHSQQPKLSPHDHPRAPHPAPRTFLTTFLPLDDYFISKMLTEQNRTPQYIVEARAALELLSREKGKEFIEVGVSESYPSSIRWEWLEHKGISAPTQDYSVLNTLIRSGYQKSGRWTDWAPTLLTHYFNQFPKPLDAHYIRAFRHIPTRLEEFKEEHDVDKARDRGIIDMLAEWQNPELSNWSQKQKFRTLEQFLCSVLKRSIKIEVTSTKSAIIIEEYGRPVHLEALGTGIHQLLYFAIEALSKSQSVVCIEEPELHLHPELQNQLIQFLSNETDNQYFITTHSPHLIDSADAAIFQVSMDEVGASHVQSAPSLLERRRFLHQLGYRPSDILQSNCIVWVEGPSDRIYILRWLQHLAPELREGWHYSIMFYGGRLLSNLKIDPNNADDLISLLHINQHAAVIIDSDFADETSRLNDTKRRIVDEVESIDGFYWITEGRTIENYLPRELRERVLTKLYGPAVSLAARDEQYGDPLKLRGTAGKAAPKKVDKIAVARSATEDSMCDMTSLNLSERVHDLAAYIRKCNGIG